MAKKIIKAGKKEFRQHCYWCDCDFTYELEDIEGNTVSCPCCFRTMAHRDSALAELPTVLRPRCST